MIERAKLFGFDGASISWVNNLHEGRLAHKNPRDTPSSSIWLIPLAAGPHALPFVSESLVNQVD